LKIPGTGAVESLNVASAASVIVAEWFRQHRAR
jgi:tRNA G18 (ribose-2'-O)-methylase SpoU